MTENKDNNTAKPNTNLTIIKLLMGLYLGMALLHSVGKTGSVLLWFLFVAGIGLFALLGLKEKERYGWFAALIFCAIITVSALINVMTRITALGDLAIAGFMLYTLLQADVKKICNKVS